MTHLDSGFNVAPHADFSSLDFDIVSTSLIGRRKLGTFLDQATRRGQHIHLPFVHMDKASGFCLRPDSKSGRRINRGQIVHDICIDGEIWEMEDGLEMIVKPLKPASQIFWV